MRITSWKEVLELFQSRTGFPGHLADTRCNLFTFLYRWFQSRTGFPGHLAPGNGTPFRLPIIVSIPNGLPRPFSRYNAYCVAIRYDWFQSRTGFPGHLALGN